jgi:hypothetical protein
MLASYTMMQASANPAIDINVSITILNQSGSLKANQPPP